MQRGHRGVNSAPQSQSVTESILGEDSPRSEQVQAVFRQHSHYTYTSHTSEESHCLPSEHPPAEWLMMGSYRELGANRQRYFASLEVWLPNALPVAVKASASCIECGPDCCVSTVCT